MLPPEHAERRVLADEVHARPPQPLDIPGRATYVAVLVDSADREREHAHMSLLCERFAVRAPPRAATHFSAQLGALRLKWKRHGEFSATPSSATPQPFAGQPVTLLAADWLAALPGHTVAAAHANLPEGQDEPADAAFLAAHFGGNIVVGAELGDGAGLAYTDFRINADGCARFLLIDRSLTSRQAGRMLQRLFEIEVYRAMALLALPVARRQAGHLTAIENSLASLTGDMAGGCAVDELLLQSLTRLAAEVESDLAASQFRFGTCRAYFELVTTRIAELRELRLPGLQTIEEFMARRLTPAVATCNSTSMQLHQLSERVAQASALLSTPRGYHA